MSALDNPPAFPSVCLGDPDHPASVPGMLLRDWYAGQALANPMICTGTAPDYQLTAWFGKTRTGITRPEIVARQAGDFADAMLAARAHAMQEGGSDA